MKIAIADDHALIRDGLVSILNHVENVTGVLKAKTLGELEDILDINEDVSLVLLDLAMPGMEGVKTLTMLRKKYPMSAVAIFSATEAEIVAKRFLDAGAVGYIPKSANNDILLNAIRLILSGGIYVPNFALPIMTKNTLANTNANEQPLKLSNRQIDVLSLMVEGMSNKGIARELDLTESTVKAHTSAVLKAFGVDNRTKAICEAIRLGVVELPGSSGGPTQVVTH